MCAISKRKFTLWFCAKYCIAVDAASRKSYNCYYPIRKWGFSMKQQTPHTTELSVFRQRKIEECLLQNMQTQNYDHISVADMCRQMGVSRRLYYTYFPDKESCLVSLIDRILHESMEAVPITLRKMDSISDSIIAYLLFWQEHKQFLDVIVKHRLKGLLIERSYVYFLNDGSFVLSFLNIPDVKSDNTVLWLYAAARFAVIFQWHEHNFSQSVEEMALKYERLLRKPLIQDVF